MKIDLILHESNFEHLYNTNQRLFFYTQIKYTVILLLLFVIKTSQTKYAGDDMFETKILLQENQHKMNGFLTMIRCIN